MLFDDITSGLEDNKNKREKGEIIAIPFPFKRFNKFIPGIQRGRYIICTASTKVGKSKFTDFMFVYGVLDWMLNNPNVEIDVKINYFSLEMSKEDKIKEAISYYLYSRKNIILTPDRMDSLYDDYILTDSHLSEIKDLRVIFEFFHSKVDIFDNISNPFGIYKEIRKQAHENGYYVDKNENRLSTEKIEDGEESEIIKIFSYRSTNSNLYVINIVDHFGLLKPENKHLKSSDPLRATIKEFSSNYALKIRDRWKHIIVGIQQQANAQESVDNFKLNKLRPSGAGLGDCKDTQRDVDMMLGLFSPIRHELNEWNNYPIDELRDQYRELSVILNRRGNATITNLWFNGASNYFEELPRPDDAVNIAKIITKTKQLQKEIYK